MAYTVLASLSLLLVSFLAVADVLVVDSIPTDPSFLILAGKFTYNIVQWTMGHTRLSDNRTPEFEKLSDIGSRSQSIGLSDIRHTKNNRLSSSAK
jgi:hypothetical protein